MHWTETASNLAIDHPHGDPYVAWAEATRWRGFRRLLGARLGSGDPHIPGIRILVQADSPEAAHQAIEDHEASGLWTVAPAYRQRPLRHFVAEVCSKDLPALEALRADGLVWELALPFRDAETAARAQVIGAYGETRQATDFRPAPVFRTRAPDKQPAKLAGTVMAVIDFGFPFLHQAFRDDHGNCRIHSLWDQGAEQQGAPSPWSKARMGYGRELRQPALQQVLEEFRSLNQSGEFLDEAEAYRRLDYLIDYDDARRRVWAATHGSHVASVAAGRTDPLRPAPPAPDPAGATPLRTDAAGAAPLVLVQLPALTAADSGGGSLSAQVLDAVHHVLEVCEERARIVLTLSYGSLAGPHDGSTLIEQALDELILHVQARGGLLALVLGAGNSRQAACHVRRTVRKDRSALLRIGLAEGDFTDTYVETWFHDPTHLGDVSARVRTGEGDWSPWIGPDEAVSLTEGRPGKHDPGLPVARLSFQTQVPNGSKPLLLLAVAPTARPADDDGPLAPAGPWQIEIRLAVQGEQTADLDAWVERDDPGWLGFGVQPRFEEQRWGDDQETLSSLVSGRYTVAAGGFRLSDGLPAAYSATGTRRGPPLVYAACEESEVLPTVLGAATRSGDSLRMCGTSVAAPVLARCLYNWMTANPQPLIDVADWTPWLARIVGDEQASARREDRPPKLRLGPVP